MKIDKNTSEPIYIQLKKKIIQKIDSGEYKAGEKIPSERKLSEEFGVSRMTVRQSINELVLEKKLYRERGRGTFVESLQFTQTNLKSFTETLLENGFAPNTQILEFSKVHHLDDISKMMGIQNEEYLYKIKRLRYANNVPIALETVYLPCKYCEDLENYDIKESLYNILKQHYGYTIESESCEIEAEISDKYLMKVFEVQSRIPLLKVSGVNISSENIKLYYEIAYYRSDLYKYKVDLFKKAFRIG